MKLNKAYLSAQFIIQPVSWLVNPFIIMRYFLYRNIKKQSGNFNGRLLDYGCGRKPYRSLFSVDEYVGLDIQLDGIENEWKDADVYFDGINIPIENEYFEGVLMTEVLEHVFEPDMVLSEINRVMKMEGKLLITAPFMWPEHDVPYDYARYTPYSIKHLLSKHGFEIESIVSGPSALASFWQLVIAWFYSALPNNKYVRLLFTLVIIAPFNLVGFFLSFFVPIKSGFYLNNVVLARKIK